MTEAEWGRCTDPDEMLLHLHRRGRRRKLRLFASACVRRVWHLLADVRSRRSVEQAEHDAEGQRAAGGRRAARGGLAAGSGRIPAAVWYATHAARDAAEPVAWQAAFDAARAARLAARGATAAERRVQVALLRCVFGNPFRPVALDPSWRTPDVVSLAQAAYDNRALPAGTLEPERLALLADALEEAGCANADLLAHLRGGGPHVRGCWALDLILAKR